MNRRTAIQNVIIIGAGTTLFTSCQDQPSIPLKNLPLTGSQENLLSAITETIIPTTDFVGAKELESHRFVLIMTDDCASPVAQKNFLDGMKLFEAACKLKYNTRFPNCSQRQKEDFLLWIEAKTDVKEEIISFYKTVKGFTIQSFTSSEAFLSQVRNYKLIPGPYKGCVPVLPT